MLKDLITAQQREGWMGFPLRTGTAVASGKAELNDLDFGNYHRAVFLKHLGDPRV
jgi:hypothetical protein